MRFPRSKILALALLAFLSVLAYAPSLHLPLIEDDYPNITLANHFGTYLCVFDDPVFRLRATSLWTMRALWSQFQLTPPVYHVVSLLLHILCVWLVYAGCLTFPRLRPAAFFAAAFFAVYEGHQEAVMWFSAINEPLQFLFGVAALLCFARAANMEPGSDARGIYHRWSFEIAGVVCFAFALISKESAIIFLPLFALAAPLSEWRRTLLRLLPYLLLGLMAAALVAALRTYSFRFSDGSFSLHAPFWITLPRSLARLFWVWGFVTLAILFFYRKRRGIPLTVALTLGWIVAGFLPYIFLTYSTQIPSRQTYIASAGLAVLVGLAMVQLFETGGVWRKAAIALAAVMLIHNVGYIWTKKQAQFVARAQPTEDLIRLAHRTGGPIWVKCFPRNLLIPMEALHLGAGLPYSDILLSESQAARHPPAAVFCQSR